MRSSICVVVNYSRHGPFLRLIVSRSGPLQTENLYWYVTGGDNDEKDSIARELAATYSMIHRIERNLAASKKRREERAKQEVELTAPAEAHATGTVDANQGIASSGSGTVATYTPH